MYVPGRWHEVESDFIIGHVYAEAAAARRVAMFPSSELATVISALFFSMRAHADPTHFCEWLYL